MSTPTTIALRSFVYGIDAPYFGDADSAAESIFVFPVSVKASFGIARRGAFVHRVDVGAGTVEGERVRFAARWICAGDGTTDAIFLPDAHGLTMCWLCDAEREPVVYRCLDGEGCLLYIGCTDFWLNRERLLASQEHWWPEVKETRLEPWPDISAARQAEARAIQDEQPLHNIALKSRGGTRERRQQGRMSAT